MQETWVRSLGWKDPLEKGMAPPTPVFLPGEFRGQRSLAGYSPWSLTKSQTWLSNFHFQRVDSLVAMIVGTGARGQTPRIQSQLNQWQSVCL